MSLLRRAEQTASHSHYPAVSPSFVDFGSGSEELGNGTIWTYEALHSVVRLHCLGFQLLLKELQLQALPQSPEVGQLA